MIERDITELQNRQFIRIGIVSEIDWQGTAEGNYHNIKPAAKVIISEGVEYKSPWLRIVTPKNDVGGIEYEPLDIGSEVTIVCPGGSIGQGIIIGSPLNIPSEAGDSDAQRSNRAVSKFGDLLVYRDRTEGSEEYTITIPGSAEGSHLFTLRRKIDSRGIVIQTAGGHYLVFQDIEADKKIELKHSSGTRITIGPDGSWEVVIEGDQTEHVAGDRNVTVLGDDTEQVGGDQQITVGKSVQYSAARGVTINGLSLDLNSQTTVNIRTLINMLGGVVTQVTQPCCNYNGAPLGCTVNLKVGV